MKENILTKLYGDHIILRTIGERAWHAKEIRIKEWHKEKKWVINQFLKM